MGNCRINTVVENLEGKQIFLELIGTGTIDEDNLPYKFTGYAMYCHYHDKYDLLNNSLPDLSHIKGEAFEYSKEGILKFVNENLNCDYTDIDVTN